MDIPTQRDGDGFRRERLENESTKELVREFVAEGRRLMREEARLIRLEAEALVDEGRERLDRDIASAKAEIKEEATKAAKAGGAVGAGGILAQAALYLGLFTLVFGLSTLMPAWVACLIVAVAVGCAGAFLIYGGLKRFKSVQLAPRRTLHNLEEDRQWMKDKARALKSTIRANA